MDPVCDLLWLEGLAVLYCIGLGGPDEIAEPRVSVGEPPTSDVARSYSLAEMVSSFERWIVSLVSFDDNGLVGRAVRRGAGAIVVDGCASPSWEDSDNAIAGRCGRGNFAREAAGGKNKQVVGVRSKCLGW